MILELIKRLEEQYPKPEYSVSLDIEFLSTDRCIYTLFVLHEDKDLRMVEMFDSWYNLVKFIKDKLYTVAEDLKATESIVEQAGNIVEGSGA